MSRRLAIYRAYKRPTNSELLAARDAGLSIESFRRRCSAEHQLVDEAEAEAEGEANQ